jgi:hypothetical protein
MVDPSPEVFTKAVAAAVVDATAGREELGRARAAEFSAAPDKFDPRALLVLGAPGLQAFASAIGVLDIGIQPLPERTQVERSAPAVASGWSSQEGAIISFESFGAIAGILAGFVAIVTISLLAWLGR